MDCCRTLISSDVGLWISHDDKPSRLVVMNKVVKFGSPGSDSEFDLELDLGSI